MKPNNATIQSGFDKLQESEDQPPNLGALPLEHARCGQRTDKRAVDRQHDRPQHGHDRNLFRCVARASHAGVRSGYRGTGDRRDEGRRVMLIPIAEHEVPHGVRIIEEARARSAAMSLHAPSWSAEVLPYAGNGTPWRVCVESKRGDWTFEYVLMQYGSYAGMPGCEDLAKRAMVAWAQGLAQVPQVTKSHQKTNLAETIVEEIFRTIERENRINKDDLIQAVERYLSAHPTSVETAKADGAPEQKPFDVERALFEMYNIDITKQPYAAVFSRLGEMLISPTLGTRPR